MTNPQAYDIISTSKREESIKITYEDIQEIYQDIIDLCGEDLGDQIMVAVHTAPHVDITYQDFLCNHCAACGDNWVAMVYYGLKSIAPSVTALIPDKIQHPMKEFITLNNIAYL